MPEPYDLLLVDLPLWYAKRNAGTSFGAGASGQYPMIKDREMMKLAPLIRRIMKPDSIMALWSTGPKTAFCFKWAEECDLDPITKLFCWVKVSKKGAPRTLVGSYTASNTEDVWLMGKGAFLPPTRRLVNQVIVSTLGEHSAKPVEIHHRLNVMYPTLRKAELFARDRRVGWDCYGNELDGRDIRVSLADALDRTQLDEWQNELLDQGEALWVELAFAGFTSWHLDQLMLDKTVYEAVAERNSLNG